MIQKQKVSIFWFRRDLRLTDNTGLQHALDSKYPVIPIFIFDPNILGKLESKKDARLQFIHQKVLDIKDSLEQLGSTLLIFHATPETAFQNLIKSFHVENVFANKDYEPATCARDQIITELLETQKISFHLFKDQVIFEGAEILKQDGTPYKVFTPFKRTWLQKYYETKHTNTNETLPAKKFLQTDPIKSPLLTELGFENTNTIIPALEIDYQLIKHYDKIRDYPAKDATSKLGIHLRFGTISIRQLVHIAATHNDTWLNELIWREFYSSILQHFPHVATSAFNKKYERIPWNNDELEFEKWCNGTTGYPIVDAGMRQLNQTGYMHNRARMITASFLTKHLLIDWRWGEAYFARKLLDFDLASNNGGWQWAAGTGTDAQPYFRVFNPETQAQKFDPKHEYIQRWVPEYGTPAYALPMIDHKLASVRAIETYKKAIS